MTDEQLKLMSWEGDLFTAPVEICQMVAFLESLPDQFEEVSLADSEIDSESLGLVLDYCRRKNYFPTGDFYFPVISNNLAQYLLNPTDLDFVKSLSYEQLIKVASTAHKLIVADLMEVCAIRIASEFADEDSLSEISNLVVSFEEDEYMRTVECEWISKS